MNPSECLRVALCVYLGCSRAETCPVSGHTRERDAIAGRLDEWVARPVVTETNVTAPVSPKGGGRSTTGGRTRDGGHLPSLAPSATRRSRLGGRWRVKGDRWRTVPSRPSIRSAGANVRTSVTKSSVQSQLLTNKQA